LQTFANVARDFRWQTKHGDGGAIREKLSLSAFPGSRFGKGCNSAANICVKS